MNIYLPYDIINYIFAFQNKYKLFQNRDKLKFINITKLYQIPSINSFSGLSCIRLKINDQKVYIIEKWSFNDKYTSSVWRVADF
jgi:hypothetical protein